MRFVYNALFALTLIGGSAMAWFLPGPRAHQDPVASDAISPRHGAIAFYERRLGEDPHSALDMAQLAALRMEQGRAMGDERAFAQAESLARRSLGERTRKNGRSAALLTNALLAQHRFAEARDVAENLVNAEPDEPAYRALAAETLLETGDYDAAIAQLSTIRARRADLGIAPRFARWAELTGRVGEARRILLAARDEAATRSDLSTDQRIWFDLRLADLELRHGNVRSAAAAIEHAAKHAPDDWRLTLARARLEAARGSWRASARYAEDVIAIVPSPEAFALLATARRSVGRIDDAIALETVLEGYLAQAGAIHRNWVFTLIDRGVGMDAVIAAVSADTLVRRDVHTMDLLAWALYRAGRPQEALAFVRRAMRMGTAEPSLRFHAAVIEAAAGDAAAARRHFDVARQRRRALSHDQVLELRRSIQNRTVASRN